MQVWSAHKLCDRVMSGPRLRAPWKEAMVLSGGLEPRPALGGGGVSGGPPHVLLWTGPASIATGPARAGILALVPVTSWPPPLSRGAGGLGHPAWARRQRTALAELGLSTWHPSRCVVPRIASAPPLVGAQRQGWLTPGPQLQPLCVLDVGSLGGSTWVLQVQAWDGVHTGSHRKLGLPHASLGGGCQAPWRLHVPQNKREQPAQGMPGASQVPGCTSRRCPQSCEGDRPQRTQRKK